MHSTTASPDLSPSPHPDYHDTTEFYTRTCTFYQKCSSLYDCLYPDHLAYSERLFADLLPFLDRYSVRKVLDASCGIGHDMASLLQHGLAVDGVDISEAMLHEARKRLSAKGFHAFSLSPGDARFLHALFPPDAYDMVLFRGNTLSNITPPEWAWLIPRK